MSAPLGGRHALVTGAARGIGAAIARELAARGARVTLLGRNATRLDEQLSILRESAEVQGVVADVTDERALREAFEAARRRFGDVAILVNNAGIARSRAFAAMDTELWNELLAVNLTGTYLCCREAVEPMTKARWGRIVNVASTAGLLGGPYISGYCASKHGVIGLTRALAAELVRYGITVNAVCPGYTESDMLDVAVQNIVATTGREPEATRTMLAATNPMRRFVLPEEVAHAVAWLCDPRSDAVSGQAIVIAGGEARPA